MPIKLGLIGKTNTGKTTFFNSATLSSEEILGKKCYDSISEIDEEIEIVDIFRPSDQVLAFVQEAIKKKPKVIWLQEGIHNSEAEELARKEGIKVVYNRCMLAEHKRLC